MQVLDKGEIGLLSSMGTDRTIAQAAWVSYGKQDEEKTDEEVGKLINYLAKHRHGTPFEHVVFQFYIKAPLSVTREWQRHRIGSFNEISGRYVTFKPEFYVPNQFRVKAETNKQGSVIPTGDQIPDKFWNLHDRSEDVENWNDYQEQVLTDAYVSVYTTYLAMKEDGVANELARLILPLGLYTEFWWTVNLRSLLNFVSLRSAPNAMWEIQEYSRAIEEILKDRVPLAYESFINNGRIAP